MVNIAKRDRDDLNGFVGRSLVFYAQYHEHPVNIAIHMVFVPTIMFSALILLAYLPSLRDFKDVPAPERLPLWLDRSWDVSIGGILVVLYATLYSAWDPVAGLLWTGVTAVPMLIGANYVQSEVHMAWAWALGLQVLSWYMQIHPGHFVYEKRKPALIDSLFQAFSTGPLFVWLDGLFLLGYRPQLKAAVEEQVHKSKQKMASAQVTDRAKAA